MNRDIDSPPKRSTKWSAVSIPHEVRLMYTVRIRKVETEIPIEVHSMTARLLRSVLTIGFGLTLLCLSLDAASNLPIPPAKVDAQPAATPGKQTAVFAGGCFWCTQAVFERVKFVLYT